MQPGYLSTEGKAVRGMLILWVKMSTASPISPQVESRHSVGMRNVYSHVLTIWECLKAQSLDHGLGQKACLG